MPTARDIPGVVFKHGSVVLLARIVGHDGRPITRAVIDSIQYTIEELDLFDLDYAESIAGHTGVPLDAGDVIFDTLQRDEIWDTDALGYNFRHEIDVSQHAAFLQAGLFYRVRYELTPEVGQPIVARFKLRAI